MEMRADDVRGKNVFISGPMTGMAHYNVGKFVDSHAMLRDMGAVRVFDPAVEYLLYAGPERTHDEWVRVCLHELTSAHYDVLVSLPGWEGSEGATAERGVAKACGMAILDLEEENEG